MGRHSRRGVLAATAALALLRSGTSRADQFINVLTGGTAGVYYPLGVALAGIYSATIPGARATTQATKASVENLTLLQGGKGEIAFTLGDLLIDAWKAMPTPASRRRSTDCAASPASTTTTSRSWRQGIGNQDAGRPQGQAAVGGGAQIRHRAERPRHPGAPPAFPMSDLGKVEYLPFAESVELMKNRQLDATLQSAGLGVASIRDLASSVAISVVRSRPKLVQKVGLPYHTATIPAGPTRARTPMGDRRRTQFPRHADGGQRPAGLRDDKADVRQSRQAGGRPQRRQGHQARQRAPGHADTAASRSRALYREKGLIK